MSKLYGKMMDDAYGPYYEKFRALGALSKETAVTYEELFPEGMDMLDRDRMHKMLSSEIVKRVGMNKYWLNEKVANNPGWVLRQRLLVIAAAIVLALVYLFLQNKGILPALR